jgi:predicted secreted hydrolase
VVAQPVHQVQDSVVSGGKFEVAAPDYTLSFPHDHGVHLQYQTEWWYYTGQLYERGAQPFRDPPRYGFQLTFFRRANNATPAGVEQEFMAHAVLIDVRAGKTIFSGRLGGAALAVAGSSRATLSVWSGDWSADLVQRDHILRFSLPAVDGGVERRMRIVARAPGAAWMHGDRGFSKKGACATCASIYYSIPDLKVSAVLFSGDELQELQGVGWMDHEFMTNPLTQEQHGWDWMGLLLRDGRRLMVFQVRDVAGGVTYTAGSLQAGDRAVSFTPGAIRLTAGQRWKSPRTGFQYPLSWRVEVPSEGIDMEVSARVADAEIGAPDKGGARDLPVYWEGPVASSDEGVIGYLEMTGYGAKKTLS